MKVECVVCGKQFITNRKIQFVCSPECNKIYHKEYVLTFQKLNYNTRYSKQKYTNSKEKLLAIKEKYKNGVSKEMIEKWLEVI
ncbi:hypothetical protein [Treponema sp.]|uniref:hypothetical protein n=1 Tax=Treponema sp. TaxID=166 RepID=UPI003FD764A8